jgi:hypothetical protein
VFENAPREPLPLGDKPAGEVLEATGVEAEDSITVSYPDAANPVSPEVAPEVAVDWTTPEAP